jgi:hypothetical protein
MGVPFKQDSNLPSLRPEKTVMVSFYQGDGTGSY